MSAEKKVRPDMRPISKPSAGPTVVRSWKVIETTEQNHLNPVLERTTVVHHESAR